MQFLMSTVAQKSKFCQLVEDKNLTLLTIARACGFCGLLTLLTTVQLTIHNVEITEIVSQKFFTKYFVKSTLSLKNHTVI